MKIATAAALTSLALSPVFASATPLHHGGIPQCAQIAERIMSDPAVRAVASRIAAPAGNAQRFLDHWEVLAATSVITPASGATPAYCQVNLTQSPTVNIRVGLPLSAADGGSGGVQGAWNGKVENLGGGGWVGTVGAVTAPVTAGYVGSSTDTGHSRAWCNAINPATGQPNSLPNCGIDGGGFILDPQNNLLEWQVQLYIEGGILEQTVWALTLTDLYYGRKADRNYWVGCSQGGRQGMFMAQNYPRLFDGILAGAPAININRFIQAEQWPPTVARDLLGPAGLSPAKSAAANAAAIAACDANDGVVDGLVNEPRRCTFDANALRCTGSASDPPSCVTPQEAQAINMIWDGPRNAGGERLFGGIPKGVTFNTLLPGGNRDIDIVRTFPINWVRQDPTFDVSTYTIANFADDFEIGYEKYREYGTDSTDLDGVRLRGVKIIHYHGTADPLEVPFNSHTYISRVFERYGVPETQSFMRSFYYPGNAHCGRGTGPQIDQSRLFDVLRNWVENGVAPDYVVASQDLGGGAIRTRKICKYPDEAMYNGSGSTDDEANFHCAVHNTEPTDLRDASRSNHD
jgi:Tannase and feruloyl esterase